MSPFALDRLARIRHHRRELAEGALARARRIEAERRAQLDALEEERTRTAQALREAEARGAPERPGRVSALDRTASALVREGLAESLSGCGHRIVECTAMLRQAEAAAAQARRVFAAAARREEAVVVLAREARQEQVRIEDRAFELAAEDASGQPDPRGRR